MKEKINSLVKSYWSVRADAFQHIIYDEDHSIWLKQITPFISTKDSLILDAGCASGYLSLMLAKNGFKNITGADFCAEMILMARENAVKCGCDITYVEVDLGDTTFDNNQFDVIVARNFLWQLSDPEKVLNELYRVLKKGGVFIYFDANRIESRNENRLKDLAQFFPSLQNQRPQWDINVLTKCGFTCIKTQKNIDSLKDYSPSQDELQVFMVSCKRE
jgi:ubiquinone/menaquinone biosynthesis C-methylase UbiE